MTPCKLIIHPKLHPVALRLREKAHWILMDMINALNARAARIERLHRRWGIIK